MSGHSEYFERKVRREVDRWNQMEKVRRGDNAKPITTEEYLKFVLKSGSVREKGVLVRGIGERLVLMKGKVSCTSF